MEFNITARITVSCTTRVEASTKEEALEIAAARHVAEVVCTEEPQDAWVVDTDGVPKGLCVDE